MLDVLYIIRHGEEADREGTLTPQAVRDLQTAATQIANHCGQDVGSLVIYTSPAKRAVSSTSEVAKALPCNPFIVEDIRFSDELTYWKTTKEEYDTGNILIPALKEVLAEAASGPRAIISHLPNIDSIVKAFDPTGKRLDVPRQGPDYDIKFSNAAMLTLCPASAYLRALR